MTPEQIRCISEFNLGNSLWIVRGVSQNKWFIKSFFGSTLYFDPESRRWHFHFEENIDKRKLEMDLDKAFEVAETVPRYDGSW